MKKTLTLAMGALALCVSSAFADISITTNSGTLDKADIAGWVESLDSSLLSSSEALTDTVYLKGITVTTPDTDSYATPVGTTVKVAVFTFTDIDSLGTLLGVSDTATYANNSTLTFNFDSIALESDTAYRFSFWTSSATEDEPAFDDFRIQLVKTAPDSGEGLVNSSGDFVYTDYSPFITYTVVNSTPAAAIPEPTTATLSLLALAGLAARRRRK